MRVNALDNLESRSDDFRCESAFVRKSMRSHSMIFAKRRSKISVFDVGRRGMNARTDFTAVDRSGWLAQLCGVVYALFDHLPLAKRI